MVSGLRSCVHRGRSKKYILTVSVYFSAVSKLLFFTARINYLKICTCAVIQLGLPGHKLNKFKGQIPLTGEIPRDWHSSQTPVYNLRSKPVLVFKALRTYLSRFWALWNTLILKNLTVVLWDWILFRLGTPSTTFQSAFRSFNFSSKAQPVHVESPMKNVRCRTMYPMSTFFAQGIQYDLALKLLSY